MSDYITKAEVEKELETSCRSGYLEQWGRRVLATLARAMDLLQRADDWSCFGATFPSQIREFVGLYEGDKPTKLRCYARVLATTVKAYCGSRGDGPTWRDVEEAANTVLGLTGDE